MRQPCLNPIAYLAEGDETSQVRLLNRSARKVSLTEVGRAYYERCVARPAWQRTLVACAERTGVSVDDIR